ncbi:MAG: sulfite exporter TauE/SafE family protein [Chloroflexi bacterium]|nr:sulfite exporter TauE/SafE family protein [Chloroflexota bacterium]
MTTFHFIFLPLFGFAVGVLGTLIGAGGGFLLVPVLLVLYPHSSPATITAISLAVILLNASSGTFGYARERRIDYRTGLILTATAVPAAVAGALMTRLVSRQLFELIFGLAMVLGAVYVLWKSTGEGQRVNLTHQVPNRLLRDRQGTTYSFHVSQLLAAVISPAAGFVSSFLGIGGGIIHVPALALLLRVPARVATATSHFVLVFTSLTAVLVHIFTGQFHEGWRRAGLLGLGALLGAQIGVYLANRVNPRLIMLILSLGLAAAGIRQVLASIA